MKGGAGSSASAGDLRHDLVWSEQRAAKVCGAAFAAGNYLYPYRRGRDTEKDLG